MATLTFLGTRFIRRTLVSPVPILLIMLTAPVLGRPRISIPIVGRLPRAIKMCRLRILLTIAVMLRKSIRRGGSALGMPTGKPCSLLVDRKCFINWARALLALFCSCLFEILRP